MIIPSFLVTIKGCHVIYRDFTIYDETMQSMWLILWKKWDGMVVYTEFTLININTASLSEKSGMSRRIRNILISVYTKSERITCNFTMLKIQGKIL